MVNEPLSEANMASLNSSMELKDDTVIVVLGASGDLAKKKTVCFSHYASTQNLPSITYKDQNS